jgi:hypothetical protein
MCAGYTCTPTVTFKEFYFLPTECICVDGFQKQQLIFPYAREEGSERHYMYYYKGETENLPL